MSGRGFTTAILHSDRSKPIEHGSLHKLDILNKLQIVVSSSNLADTRTLAIPVAHTIYFEMGPKRRSSIGIAESLIRVSVGIEDYEDLIADFRQALG